MLLLEGSSRISTAIKYLTQSTWSHAGCVGPHPGPKDPIHLVEADVVKAYCVPASIYLGSNVRICRPWGLDSAQRKAVTTHALARLATSTICEISWIWPATFSPAPALLAPSTDHLGSGDPTRAIAPPSCRGIPVRGLSHPARTPRHEPAEEPLLRARHHPSSRPGISTCPPSSRCVNPASF